MILFFSLSFLICLGFTPLVRFIAAKKGWMAHPKKDRWHQRPTALMGGIAIYTSVAGTLLYTTDFSTLLPYLFEGWDLSASGYPPLPSVTAVIWIGMTMLFILGLTDDFISLRPQTKLVGQILAASMVTFLGFRLHWFTSLTLDTIITIIWIVGITNAFNLIDNMDGLCAGVGLIAAAHLAILFSGDLSDFKAIVEWRSLNPAGAAAMILAGALTAFLIFNFNPASIFMGDCGSLMIGFFLSMLSLYYCQDTAGVSQLAVYAVPVMILLAPVMDTAIVTIVRLLSGRKASTGGRDHTSHRLVLMGFSERDAVLCLYGMGIVSGVAALFVSRHDTLTSPAVIIPLGVAILLMGVWLAQLRVYPEKEFSLLRDRAYTPILIELTYKRQIVMVILDFCLIAFSYYLSFRLRFQGEDFVLYFKVFLRSLPAVIACKFIAFFAAGVYRGFWRYISTPDVFLYLKASFFATLLSVAVVTYIYRFQDFLKGIFLTDWLLCTGLVLGARGFFRISADAMNRKTLAGETVFIYGAGRGGEILLREILNNKALNIKPAGFIDDDPLKIRKKLQGYPILGTFQDIDPLCEKYNISGILISFRNNDPVKISALREFCTRKDLFLKRFSIKLESVDSD